MKTDKFHQLPHWPLRFLRWFCPPHLYEGIEGDLLEKFEEDFENHKERYARRQLMWNVLRFFRPGIVLRNSFQLNLFNTAMTGNYIRIASRNMMRRKFYSFINAFGLSIGIAFCILIYLYIQDERSFDQFHENKDRILRMEARSFDIWNKDSADPYYQVAWLQPGLKQALKDELPEVEFATRYNPDGNCIFRYGEKVMTESVTYVDGDFFNMFSFPLVKGNAEKLFATKTEVVLSEKVAAKYFDGENPLGKTVEIDLNGTSLFTVVGIIADPPSNSSLKYGILVPQENRMFYERSIQQWGMYSTPTFVQLRHDANPEIFQQNLEKVVHKYMGETLEEWRKDENIPDDVRVFELRFSKLPDIHLKKEISWEKVSDPKYSYILGGIAFLILLIACINYISLALTTSASRRTEVGIRKVVGALKGQLVYQFVFESLLLALGSFVFALGLVVLFLPAFNEFTGKDIVWIGSEFWISVVVGFLITIVVALLAGAYPSFFLSAFRPVAVLRGQFTSRLQAGFARPLVVLQFAMTATLIICSVVMYRQMQFITTKDLGYDKEQVLVVPTQTGWNAEANVMVERFRTMLQHEPVVTAVAGTSASFNAGWSQYGYQINGEQKAAYVYTVDSHYIPLLNLEILEGRNFDATIASDTNAVIVNEALVRDMKWTDPLQEHLDWREDSIGRGPKVIGVVKDYHFLSLEQKIEPMFLTMDTKNSGFLTSMLVKVAPGDIPNSIERVKGHWEELTSDKPFEFVFLDQQVAGQYESYQRWTKITGLSTGFAILISCLGLFGLSGINALNRTKEIGIRKVMGASLQNIFMLLNRQYVWLGLIAFTLAVPLSWWVMHQWLNGFEFKIAIGWELFVLSMVTGLVIALGTVSYHAIKAALINPADTLKYE